MSQSGSQILKKKTSSDSEDSITITDNKKPDNVSKYVYRDNLKGVQDISSRPEAREIVLKPSHSFRRYNRLPRCQIADVNNNCNFNNTTVNDTDHNSDNNRDATQVDNRASSSQSTSVTYKCLENRRKTHRNERKSDENKRNYRSITPKHRENYSVKYNTEMYRVNKSYHYTERSESERPPINSRRYHRSASTRPNRLDDSYKSNYETRSLYSSNNNGQSTSKSVAKPYKRSYHDRGDLRNLARGEYRTDKEAYATLSDSDLTDSDQECVNDLTYFHKNGSRASTSRLPWKETPRSNRGYRNHRYQEHTRYNTNVHEYNESSDGDSEVENSNIYSESSRRVVRSSEDNGVDLTKFDSRDEMRRENISNYEIEEHYRVPRRLSNAGRLKEAMKRRVVVVNNDNVYGTSARTKRIRSTQKLHYMDVFLNGQTPLTCAGHTRPVVDLDFSGVTDDGYFVISACKDGKPMLRHGDTGDWIGTFEGHKGAVWGATLNQTATLAATGSADFTAKLWDPITGTEVTTFAHNHVVRTVRFNDGGNQLLTGSNEKLLRLFDLENIESEPRIITGHTGRIRGSAWLSNDKQFISASEDKTVRLWDLKAGNGHIKELVFDNIPTSLEMQPETNQILISHGYMVSFYDCDTLTLVKEFRIPTPVNSASYNKKLNQFVCGGEDFKVYKFDYDTGNEIESYKGHFGSVHCIRFSPDGELYASGSEDGTLRLWQTIVGNNYGLWKSSTNNTVDNTTCTREAGDIPIIKPMQNIAI